MFAKKSIKCSKRRGRDKQDRQTQSGYVGSLHTILVLHDVCRREPWTRPIPTHWDLLLNVQRPASVAEVLMMIYRTKKKQTKQKKIHITILQEGRLILKTRKLETISCLSEGFIKEVQSSSEKLSS